METASHGNRQREGTWQFSTVKAIHLRLFISSNKGFLELAKLFSKSLKDI